MVPGAVGHQVSIGSIFVGRDSGEAMVAWHGSHGNAAEATLDMTGYPVGNVADVIANFSSRGPSAAGTLKPDIAAPGVNVMSQGYTPGATGEARHFGYGQVSGTSMAAPHVAGAAAVLRQLRPEWSNQAIKSALMSTSKYLGISNADGSPAQPLDMGAGRLDLEAALDPGVILDPPSLSFGYLANGSSREITVIVTNVTDAAETYTTSTVFTGNGFDDLAPMAGLTVTPASLALAPGASAELTVSFNSSNGTGIGDNQGFVLLSGSNGHAAHLPAWARVTSTASVADVLLIQNDFSGPVGLTSYLGFYRDALDALGVSYDVFSDNAWFATPGQVIPHPSVLVGYKAILYFSGDNFYRDGFFSVKTPLSRQDMDRLVEYANHGGTVIVSGQDAYHVLDEHYLPSVLMGAELLRDGIAGDGVLLPQPLTSHPDVPPAFAGITLDLTTGPVTVEASLLGENVVPPATTTASGAIELRYQPATSSLIYSVTVEAADPLTIIGALIHRGGPTENGVTEVDIFPHDSQSFPLAVAGSVTWEGTRRLTAAQADLLASGGLYLSIHSLDHVDGELRANLALPVAQWSGDGAANQQYVDELAPNFMPLLHYPPAAAQGSGVVALLRRNQPSLEVPGIDFLGRMAYLGFGLEGVNDGLPGTTSRSELLGKLLDWSSDTPVVGVSATLGTSTASGKSVQLQAVFSSNIAGTSSTAYRWDFGDGSPFATSIDGSIAHPYRACGTYTARAEATGSWGNVAIGTTQVVIDSDCGTLENVFANGFEG
jgi:hypothetical protein